MGKRMWAIIPVKPFGSAKQRLAPLLGPDQREELARAMFRDVLDAVMGASVLAGALVVTSDSGAAVLARAAGAAILAESQPTGINAAVRAGIDFLHGIASGIVVVPTDIPQLTPAAIDEIASWCCEDRSLVMVRASRDGGTNLLACRPPNLVPPSFGEGSCEGHRRVARRAGLEPRLLDLGDIDRDIDRPEDVEAFLSLRPATRTHAVLAGFGLEGRLVGAVPPRPAPPERALEAEV